MAFLGIDTQSDFDERNRRRALQKLRLKLIGSGAAQAIAGQKFTMGANGKFDFTGNQPISFETVRPTSKVDPLEKFEQVDEQMAATLGIKPGFYKRRDLEKIFAPASRAASSQTATASRQDKSLAQREQLQQERLAQQKQLQDERRALQEQLKKLQAENDFRKNALKIINDPEAESDDKDRMGKALQILDETGEIPVFTEQEKKRFFGLFKTKEIVPKPRTKTAPKSKPLTGKEKKADSSAKKELDSLYKKANAAEKRFIDSLPGTASEKLAEIKRRMKK
jgi:hypothetical protein